MQGLLPGADVKSSSPADVGGGYKAFHYRTLLAVSASLGLNSPGGSVFDAVAIHNALKRHELTRCCRMACAARCATSPATFGMGG